MKFRQKILWLLCLALCVPVSAHAGAGYIITESGSPSRWDNSAAVTIHPESGVCGSFTNAQMLDKIETNLNHWTDLSEIDFNFSISSGSVDGVDGCNYGDYLVGVSGSNNNLAAGDGFNPILFDNDGEIVSEVAGTANRFRVLGFANPASFTSDFSEIVDGQAVFNCFCLAGNAFGPCNAAGQTITFSEDELDFTMVHEMGHFMNLDHTQVNCTGDGADNICEDTDASNDENIPTMYPVSINAAAQITPMQDDISALAEIYPAANFTATHCQVSGSLLYADGIHALRCADVQAIPADISKSVAFVSGAYAAATDGNGDGDTADSGECTSGCGDFELRLDPGIEYNLSVQPINSSFTGGSGISPCANGQISDIVSENIATILASQCTAGASVNLGTITTTSVYNDSQTGGVAELVTDPNAAFMQAEPAYLPNENNDAVGNDSYFENGYFSEDGMIPTVIGGAPRQQNSSCPESGNSSVSSTGGSSGCSLAKTNTFPASSGFWISLLLLLPLIPMRLACKNK